MTHHFLPGMAADARIWRGYEDLSSSCCFHNWENPTNFNFSLEQYACELIQRLQIVGNDTVIGVSMGGIMAAEIKNHIPEIAAIQVSSCTHMSQLNDVVKLLSPIGAIFPFSKLAHVPNAFLSGDVMKLTNDMYKDSDHRFISWACKSLMLWRGFIQRDNIFKILGDNDFLFPLKKQQPNHVISNGSHLMLMSHISDIYPLIKEQLARSHADENRD